jgi:hypothetical protein
VAGWAYQFIAKLNFVRESWSAPVEVRRVRPAQEDANEVAAEQVKAFLRLSPEEEEEEEEEERVAPLFVFEAGYDPRSQGATGTGGDYSVPDPPPFAGGASLLRRSESRWSTCPHWTAASPRTEDEVHGSEHLAQTLYGVRMRGLWLRDSASACLGEPASEGLRT